jgi:hypothetical protein
MRIARPNWQIVWAAAVVVMATINAAPAAAQSHAQSHSHSHSRLRSRFEISGNLGAAVAAKKFQESETFPSNGRETATIAATHNAKTTVDFNVGGAVRIASRLWAGAQYAMADMKPSASITAVVPHPLLFNAARTVQGTTSDVAHNERNVHVDVMYALPIHTLDVKVMAGPTYFNLKQDFVTQVAVIETYPFDTATFARASTTRLSKSVVGYNAGVDVSRLLSRQVGVGGLIRYSRGRARFANANVNRVTVQAGGLEAGAGIRIRF